MATARQPSAPGRAPGVTLERAVRLCRLIRLVSPRGQSRATLLRRLKLDVRAFYRDLEALTKIGLTVELREGKYTLKGDAEQALQRMPFPDPQLNVGEAIQLSKGRSAAHRKLRALLKAIVPGERGV